MGTLLRTAVAFGFTTVFCIDCVDPWSQKVLRASSGIQFNLNIIEQNLQDFKKPENSLLIAADLGGDVISSKARDLCESQTLQKSEIPRFSRNDKTGLILGSEGQGIRPEIKKLVDKTVTIPMSAGVESLNVAVAGGILMHVFASERAAIQEV